ncbi:MAG: hypothetical protein IJS63_10145 [Bacteroidaceae bacterium]|nr:hypothetical protein [Bacteroidaceae bacterium]
MKKSNSICHLPFTIYHLFSLCATLLLFTSCYQPDVVMHTVVKGSGDCAREVSYSNVMTKEDRDSLLGEHMCGWSQPMPECLNIDAFCKSQTVVGEGDTVTTTFTTPFSSAEEMCEKTPLQLNGTRLRSKAKLEKHFRWFYTEYTYTETFFCVGDTFKLAATDYADKDVVSYWFTGEPNLVQGLSGAEASQKLDEMEPFVNKWLNDNLFKVGFDFIVAHYDSIIEPPVSRECFVQLHDSLARHLLNGKEEIFEVEPAEAFRDFFHSDAYAMFFDDETPLGKQLNKEFMNRINILWFNVPYTLTMPGKVTDTGNGTLQPDGTIFYPFTGERLIPQDYTITATSRITHIWAYIVTLLIVLLAIGSYAYRRKQQTTIE